MTLKETEIYQSWKRIWNSHLKEAQWITRNTEKQPKDHKNDVWTKWEYEERNWNNKKELDGNSGLEHSNWILKEIITEVQW